MYIKRLNKTFNFPSDHTWIMGILNVTPDSFSDGGAYLASDDMIAQVKKMVSEGVDIIDVGGESTRPGHVPVILEEELKRVVPAVKAIREVSDVIISVDTWKVEVARQALEAGADIINDQWAATREPEIAKVCADFDAPLILMHNRETYKPYQNMMDEMKRDLQASIEIARKQGMRDDQLILDPGVGFAKTADDNLLAIQGLQELASFGMPILLATSRKGFLGKLVDVPANERDVATAATTVSGILSGADMVRVHNVKVNKEAAVVADAIKRGQVAPLAR
ncbi:dihydropteroate synthase [Aerococcus sp. HMSC10H05]|uniref:dihydropteroate synthase n=1 Tax=Aerococcus sp. HMSC10H05 TaxID=1581084 RepID=UPI0008A46A7F|nr:dihydropteroate synthase [Aerococcus sp. HMSC10H05]OFU52453.1 dihydropteroate synthase [Aerococcus sp. HMSC10H05]